ncbi:cell wall hydrolase [Parasphingorhabdus sp.]|uniref:cell wall hydrolase n=1 Tax=Parasphingorhabdus sp. TaxID=2709688 RepID=UPI003A94A669
MRKLFRVTSALSLALTTVAALSVTTDALFASEANDDTPESEIFVDPALLEEDQSNRAIVFAEQQEVVAEIPEDVVESDKIANGEAERVYSETGEFIDDGATTLRQLVRQQSAEGSLDAEMQCLAGTVYFESKSESLKGQLAVARVVLARVASSRFPDSICGVVYQRRQFSFIRGGKMPRIDTGHRQWRNAVAIAKIAMNDGWKSSVEGALFFHARYVSPGWRLKRLATIDNHIFYQ